ncbi:MAG TPA: GNAT family N-acetyltransferase [Patescibacteria group bacterium]|nr:GNAT family N-acetyltransferase [Patescibacteria group bacterium]
MKVTFSTDPAQFLQQHAGYLEQREAEHNLILSLARAAEQKQKRGEAIDIRFATLANDDGLVCAAVQTPPHNLVISRATMPEIEPLADALAEHGDQFPGIVGPAGEASTFSDRWTAKTGQATVEYMDQIIYSLKQVVLPPMAEGKMRLATQAEEAQIAAWIFSFSRDALPKAEQVTQAAAAKKAAELIEAQRLMVWDVKGTPVAQAAVSGTANVARISMVYTPPEARGHGYASAVVAEISQQQLDAGKKMCCLYADARNPVSNSIYRKIGYEFVGRSSLYVLGKKP